MNEGRKYKILCAVLAVLIAHFYPNIRALIDSYSFDSNRSSSLDDLDWRDIVEREIIASWRTLIKLPVARPRKVVVG
jgi:hypothetical protein